MNQKIFIFGNYGEKNTGDDAMIYSLLNELNIAYDSADFIITAREPILLPPKINNVIFVKPALLSFELYRKIMDSDIFIMGGGTQIYDYGKPLGRFVIIFWIFILTSCAKIFCKKIYFLAIGIERPKNKWGKFLFKSICKKADFISVRDTNSHNFLKEIGLTNSVLSFDLSTLLSPLLSNPNKKINKKIILGISILPFFEIYHNNKEKDLEFINEISKMINQWLKLDSKNYVYLFIFNGNKKYFSDILITEKLKEKIDMKDHVKIIFYDPNPLKTLKKIGKCDFFIGMRYHSCLFAYINSIPMINIAYFEKSKSLEKDIGLNKNAIITPEEVLNGGLIKYLNDIKKSNNSFNAKLSVEDAINKSKLFLKKN